MEASLWQNSHQIFVPVTKGSSPAKTNIARLWVWIWALGPDNSSSNKIINFTRRKYPASRGSFCHGFLAFKKLFPSLVSLMVSLLTETSTRKILELLKPKSWNSGFFELFIVGKLQWKLLNAVLWVILSSNHEGRRQTLNSISHKLDTSRKRSSWQI